MKFALETITRESVKKLKPYSSARDEFKNFDQEMIFLDANENPFDNGVNRYPDPHQQVLKKELSIIKKVPVDHILLGNGSDEVLDLIFRAFCEPKEDNVIITPPTYGMYQVLAEVNHITCKEAALNEDFTLNTARIEEQIDAQTKLLFLCTPNNPTANCFETQKIEKLLQTFKGLVVVDEAYIDFASQESWTQRLAEFPNLIVCQTLSKAYGMAGIRLGMGFASKEIINIFKKIKPPYNVNQLTQQKALEGLQNRRAYQEQVQAIVQERDRLAGELEKISFVEEVFPSEANFILIRVDDANKRYQQLLDKRIVARNRTTQTHCENCLRITVGTEKENNTVLHVLQQLAI